MFIAGNWKMNKTAEEAEQYIKKFLPLVKGSKHTIVLCVPFTCLPSSNLKLKGTNVSLAAQNMYLDDSGAYTGEISPLMVKEFADYVIIGHSERRHLFKESDVMLNKKIIKAIEHKLKVIFCVGERLEQRENGNTMKVVESQLSKGLNGIQSIEGITIAYEPVWAIGTGKTATPKQAQEVHKFIRDYLKGMFGNKNYTIIYGGSVNPENAKSILEMPDINGCLPGGASLKPESFAAIVNSVQ